ncbi:polysaccharide biosynthesis tyrosine autokinase [Methylocystis heyeri]|nr:polysaccharide biosynthesis tyrosine autokinase [Methylocystis heyeri]
MLFTPRNHSSADKHRTLDELPIIEKDIVQARRHARDSLEPRKQLIRRRLPFILLFASGGAALFLLAALMLPPTYAAKSMLIVDPQVRPPTDASNEGTASRVAEINSGSAALAIETHMGVLNSRDFLQRAVSGLSGETAPETVKQSEEQQPRKKATSGDLVSQLSERLAVWADALLKSPKSTTPIADELEKRIKIAQDGKSDIITVTFNSSDPTFAADVVNRIAESYVDNRTEMLQASTKREIAHVTANIAVVKSEVGRADASALSLLQRRPEATGETAGQGKQFTYQRLRELTSEAATARLLQPSLQRRLGLLQAELANIKPDVRVLALARTPQKPNSLNPIILAVPVFVSLLIAGSWIAAWLDKLDMRLRSEGDLHNCLGVPCSALLPRVRKKRFFQPKTREDLLGPELGPYAQAIRFLVASVHPEASERNRKIARVIMAASSLPEEGKSTLCHSLGAFVASIGLKVLIIDFDKRGPQRNAPLISTAGVVESIERIAPADADYLALGRSSGDLLRLLTSEDWANAFDELKRKYDYILLDCPPLLGVSDFRLVTPFADRILFLVKWESTKWDQARSAFRMLRGSGAPDEIMPVYTQVDLARQALYSSGALSDYFLHQRRYWASKARLLAMPSVNAQLATPAEQPGAAVAGGECKAAEA